MLHIHFLRSLTQRARFSALLGRAVRRLRQHTQGNRQELNQVQNVEPSADLQARAGLQEIAMTPLNQSPAPITQKWPLQMGQPLTEPRYAQQQSKCNRRQLGTEATPAKNLQMQ